MTAISGGNATTPDATLLTVKPVSLLSDTSAGSCKRLVGDLVWASNILPLSLRKSFLNLILRIRGINEGLGFQVLFDLWQTQAQLPQPTFVDEQLEIPRFE